MMVIFLTGLVAMILMRTLRADYARYTARDEDDLEVCRSPDPLSWPGPGSGPSPCPGSGQSPGPSSGPAGVMTARQCARLVLSAVRAVRAFAHRLSTLCCACNDAEQQALQRDARGESG
jgi:hypothetical protein